MLSALALRWPPADGAGRKAAERLAEALLSTPGWDEIMNRRGLRLFVRRDESDFEPLIAPRDGGVVLGVLFRAGEEKAGPVRALRENEADAWCADAGRSLVQNCWGGYLAILSDRARDRVLIVRDPAGARSCLISGPDGAGVYVIATDLEALAASGGGLPQIDERFIELFLSHPRIVTARTGFAGVSEVLAGECMVLGRTGLQRSLAWRPPRRQKASLDAFDRLAGELKHVVQRAALAWTQSAAPIVHRLSGGLDSSIALWALAQGAPRERLRCVTEYAIDMPESDERPAARQVAGQFGYELIELAYDPADIAYDRLLRAPLSAKPAVTDFSFADRAFVENIAAPGDGACLLSSGQGGDQVFYRSNALPAVADALRDGMNGADFLTVALDAARTAQRSVWPALATGLKLGLTKASDDYLREAVGAALSKHSNAGGLALDETLAHPWLEHINERGPGEAMRILHLADLAYYHGLTPLTPRFVGAPILTSQPIIEFCCTVPPYLTFVGGCDRALARTAFAGDLPAISVLRARKGDTTRFFAAVAARNRDFMLEVLAGGELEQLGLIDAKAIGRDLRAGPDLAMNALAWSHYLAAELWLRRVRSRRNLL